MRERGWFREKMVRLSCEVPNYIRGGSLGELGGKDSALATLAEVQTCFCQLGNDMKNNEYSTS